MESVYTIKRKEAVSQSLARPVLPETIALAAICLIDTALTIYLVDKGLAVEANPLLSWSFRYGMAGFVFAKLMWFLPPLMIIEALRPKLGQFAQKALRAGVLGYMMVYFFGTLALHPHLWR